MEKLLDVGRQHELHPPPVSETDRNSCDICGITHCSVETGVQHTGGFTVEWADDWIDSLPHCQTGTPELFFNMNAVKKQFCLKTLSPIAGDPLFHLLQIDFIFTEFLLFLVKGSLHQLHSLHCVYRRWEVLLHMWKKLKKEPFVAPEEAACNLINYPQWCHSVPEMHCGYCRHQALKVDFTPITLLDSWWAV